MEPPIKVKLKKHQLEGYERILKAFGAWKENDKADDRMRQLPKGKMN